MDVRIDTLSPEGEKFSFDMSEKQLLARWDTPDEYAEWRFGPIEAEAILAPAAGGIQLTGRLKFQYKAPCSRCWSEIEFNVDQSCWLRFESGTKDDEIELTDGAFEVLEFDGSLIDLAAWAADQVALELVDNPRCEEHAGRTCPGATVLDAVDEQKVDPRWQSLEAMRNEE